MNRFIGMDRELRLEWLDATIAQWQESMDPDRVARALQVLLENEIVGDKALKNTRTVLMRIWLKVPAEHGRLQAEGIRLASAVMENERLWLHWGMSLLAYPFFRDVAAVVGQLTSLQGTFTQAQVQRRMTETWGQRTTLERAVRRLLRTYIDWDVLRETGTRGSYTAAPPHGTRNRDLALWFFECALRANGAEQVPLRELGRLAYAFPFDLAPHLAEVRRSDRFEVLRQGHDLEMVSVR